MINYTFIYILLICFDIKNGIMHRDGLFLFGSENKD